MPSYGETVSWDDLVENAGDSLVYKKFNSIPFTGITIPSFSNEGICKRHICVARTGFENGKEHGLRETYHSNGLVWCRHNYKEGILNGYSECFHEDGKKDDRGLYKDGYREGLLETYHYPDGWLQYTITYKRGEPHGLVKYFIEDGSVESTEKWVNAVQQ